MSTVLTALSTIIFCCQHVGSRPCCNIHNFFRDPLLPLHTALPCYKSNRFRAKNTLRTDPARSPQQQSPGGSHRPKQKLRATPSVKLHFTYLTILASKKGSPTKCRSNKRRKNKTANDKMSNGAQCRMTKCQMIQNVERTKCRMGQNAEETVGRIPSRKLKFRDTVPFSSNNKI